MDLPQFVRLMQGVTKRQEQAKVAGFIRIDQEQQGGGATTNGASPSSPSSPSLSTNIQARSLIDSFECEESDRFLVVVPLSEAQSLRRAVHTAHPLFRRAGGAQFALWTLEGHLIETTPFYRPAMRSLAAAADAPQAQGEPAPSSSSFTSSASSASSAVATPQLSNYQLKIGLQIARFMNGDMYFSEEEVRTQTLRSGSESSSNLSVVRADLTSSLALLFALFARCGVSSSS